MAVKRKIKKKPNGIAKALRNPMFRQRIEANPKAYSRKKKISYE